MVEEGAHCRDGRGKNVLIENRSKKRECVNLERIFAN